MITNIETIRTTILSGDHAIGIIHQLYDVTTDDGHTRVAGQLTASRLRVGPHGISAEHTTFGEDERDSAIAWSQAGAPAPQPGTEARPTVLFDDGRHRLTWYRAAPRGAL